jgi:glycosyltransferase 2 family protein
MIFIIKEARRWSCPFHWGVGRNRYFLRVLLRVVQKVYVGRRHASWLVPSSRSRYHVVLKFLPLIGIVVLVYILSQLDIATIVQIFSSLNPWYCLLAFFFIIPILLSINIEWQIVLRRQGIHVSFWYSLKNLLIGYFYGFITPGGLGGYLQILYLRQECNEPLPKCASNIVTFHTIDFIVLLCFAVAGGVLLASQFPILLIIFVLLLALAIVLFFFFIRENKSEPFFRRLLQTRFLRFLQRYFKDPLESFFYGVPSFRSLALPFFVSFLSWTMTLSLFFLVSKLFSVDIPYLYFILMVAMSNVVASIPISIYGLGTREATLISLFALFGVSPEQTVSLSLFWFIVIWVTPSIAGAYVTIHEHKRLSELTKQAHQQEEL